MLRRIVTVAVLLGVATATWIVCLRGRSESWRLDRGHGYWSIRELAPNRRGHWERLAHYERLYDRRVDLGLVWGFSVSPRGAFAALERDGNVLLYDRSSGTIDTVCTSVEGPCNFAWVPSAKTLRLTTAQGDRKIVPLASKP